MMMILVVKRPMKSLVFQEKIRGKIVGAGAYQNMKIMKLKMKKDIPIISYI